MPEKLAPAFPQLEIEQSVSVVKVNCLERFQKLIRRVKETGLIFGRKRIEIFQTYLPDASELRIFHVRLGHIAQRGRRRILRCNFRDTSAAMHLHREIPQ